MIVTNMILTVMLLCFMIDISKYSEYFDNKCIFKVRNETETKHNETKRHTTKRNTTKRNERRRNETKYVY
jgi:hypothetical protein